MLRFPHRGYALIVLYRLACDLVVLVDIHLFENVSEYAVGVGGFGGTFAVDIGHYVLFVLGQIPAAAPLALLHRYGEVVHSAGIVRGVFEILVNVGKVARNLNARVADFLNHFARQIADLTVDGSRPVSESFACLDGSVRVRDRGDSDVLIDIGFERNHHRILVYDNFGVDVLPGIGSVLGARYGNREADRVVGLDFGNACVDANLYIRNGRIGVYGGIGVDSGAGRRRVYGVIGSTSRNAYRHAQRERGCYDAFEKVFEFHNVSPIKNYKFKVVLCLPDVNH